MRIKSAIKQSVKWVSRKFISGGLVILLLFVSQLLWAQSENVVEGVVRIKLKPEVITSASGLSVQNVGGRIQTGIQSVDKLSTEYDITKMRRVFPYSPKFEQRHIKHGLHLWYELSYDKDVSPQTLVNEFAKTGEVDISETVVLPKLVDGSGKPVYLSKDQMPKVLTSNDDMPFNDPFLYRQWHYSNTGQTGGTPGADIDLFDAWKISKGTPNVIISVHDQGVDYEHEDLRNMMWTNEAELNGEEGVDDDGNGYIDDIHGVNFSDNTGYLDVDYHGTHVAGTIAAENNNNIGVSGVAGGSGNGDGVRIMSCQILGGTYDADIPASYVYAADMGAVISQNSWGYSTVGYYSQSTNDAIDYFIEEAGNYAGSPMKGGVVIFAAGNDATQQLMYPGAYAPVIAVAALGSRSAITIYSNYGRWVDIAAPGGNMENDQDYGTTDEFSNGVLSTLTSNGYGYLEGTSMACPHVSGIAGLIVSIYGGDDFTNTDLEKHLLTGVRDIYNIEENQAYEGKLGAGYADAVIALDEDEKIAPEKITDLQVTGISQDFATLSWSVPEDEDDKKTTGFIIYYSKESLSEGNLQYVNQIEIENRDSAGVLKELIVNDLLPLTKYYFAVVGVDRWGNESVFSNIVSSTTNSGPKAYFDPSKEALNITIDVQNNSVGSDSISLFNSGEGVLRWDVLSRMVEAEPLSLKPDLNYPKLLNPNAVPDAVKAYDRNVEPSNNIQSDTTVSGAYFDESNSLMVIGETNTEIPNSSATRFYIGKESGFNMTSVDAYLEVDTLYGPVVVEVYTGYDISSAYLIHAQEYSISGFRWFSFQFDQQLYISQGAYVWVVIHVPAGNAYPLGAGLELSDAYSNNCYMSLDAGKSWQMLEDVYYDNRLVWAVAIISNKVYLGEYITFTPDSGIVYTNQSSSIIASVDGSEMINGTYKSNFVVNTNESSNSFLSVPLNVTITGHPHKITSQKRVDVGAVIVGNSKEITVDFNNTGLGRFTFVSPYIVTDDPQFEYVSGRSNNFEAGTSEQLTFRFTPTKVGNNYCDVTLKASDGKDYTFEMVGAGLEPPVAHINPATVAYENMSIGDSINGWFYLSNKGSYPLDYYIPAFADGSNMVEAPALVQKFGYSWEQDTVGTTYQWNDISASGTNITKMLYSTGPAQYEVDLDFPFPFYGNNVNKLYITNYGAVTFSGETTYNAISPWFYGYSVMPDKYIAGCGFPMRIEDAGFGNVYYKQGSDYFIIQYDHVPYGRGDGYDSEGNSFVPYITFQIILYDDGNVDMYYKDSDLDRYVGYSYVGVEDKSQEDGLLIMGYNYLDFNHYGDFRFQPKSAIHISNPGLGLFTNVTNPYGTIRPGDSTKIEYTIYTDSLFVISYKEKLMLVTNDPLNTSMVHTVDFDIVDGGSAQLVADTTVIDFGTVYKGDDVSTIFYVTNNGVSSDSILSVTNHPVRFTVSASLPELLRPGKRVPFTVQLNTEQLGEVKDTLYIHTSNEGDLVVYLVGEVTQGPVMHIEKSTGTDLTNIIKIMNSGTTATQSFQIRNSGEVDLEVEPVRNGWISIDEVDNTANDQDYRYVWKTSKEDGGPVYNWKEIVENGGTRITGLVSYQGPQWSDAIPLPFTFDFYGVGYDTLYVGLNGLVTFTPNQDDHEYYFGCTGIPLEEQPNNFIAPMFYAYGGQGSESLYPLSDPYYLVEDDRIIVEYYDFNSIFMSEYAISFQVILYNTGVIKFQYNIDADNTRNGVSPLSVIGIENLDGTEGVQVTNRSRLVNSSMAIELFPVPSYVIEPNGQKDFVFNISAKELIAGTYMDSLSFLSNDPLAKEKKIPAKLIVLGEAVISMPDTMNFGDILIDPKGSSITKTFEVKNTGTDKFTISGASLPLKDKINVEAYVSTDNGWKWLNIFNESGQVFPVTMEANSSLEMRVTVPASVPDNINDVLELQTTLSDPVQKLAILADIYESPIINLAEDAIAFYAPDDNFTSLYDLGIQNLGGYRLDYSLEMEYIHDYSSVSVSASTASVKNTNTANYTGAIPEAGVLSDAKNIRLKSTVSDIIRTLAHDTATVASDYLGYGGTYSLHAVTGFNAPEEGFNLTHVQTWYIPQDKLNTTIGVNIYAGDESIYDCTLIGSESFEYNIDAQDKIGKLVTLELNEQYKFYPNEKFFVEFVYDVDVTYPQGCVAIENDVADRYLFGVGDGWYDMSAIDDYSDLGFMIRAAEATEPGTPWVVLTSEKNGSIETSGSGTIGFSVDAKNSVKGDNYAYLHVTSNDVSTPETKVLISLRKNQGPVFDTPETYSIKESDTLDFSIGVTDYEGDEFSVALNETYPSLQIVSVDASTEMNNVSTGLSKVIHLRYTPDYFSEGTHIFQLVSTDVSGNEETTSVTVKVNNVNRSPVALSLDTLKMKVDGKYIVLYPDDIFNDPDNDIVSVVAVSDNDAILRLFNSGSDYMLVPVSKGLCQVDFSATDAYGKTAANTLNVLVGDVSTGIGNTSQESSLLEAYPNPASEFVILNIPEEFTNDNELVVGIYSFTGELIWEENLAGDKNMTFDLSGLVSGSYFIMIRNNTKAQTTKIIKQ